MLLFWRNNTSSSKFSINFDSLLLLFGTICSNSSGKASLMRLHRVHVRELVQEIWLLGVLWIKLLRSIRWILLSLRNPSSRLVDVLTVRYSAHMQGWIECCNIPFVMSFVLPNVLRILRRPLINPVIHCGHKSLKWNCSGMPSCYSLSRSWWYTMLLFLALIESRPNVFTKVLINWFRWTGLIWTI